MITPTTTEVEYGCECVCDNHRTSKSAPVAMLVRRGRNELRVCTRCVLSTDVQLAMLVTKHMTFDVFLDFDALGTMAIVGILADNSVPVESLYRHRLVM